MARYRVTEQSENLPCHFIFRCFINDGVSTGTNMPSSAVYKFIWGRNVQSAMYKVDLVQHQTHKLAPLGTETLLLVIRYN